MLGASLLALLLLPLNGLPLAMFSYRLLVRICPHNFPHFDRIGSELVSMVRLWDRSYAVWLLVQDECRRVSPGPIFDGHGLRGVGMYDGGVKRGQEFDPVNGVSCF